MIKNYRKRGFASFQHEKILTLTFFLIMGKKQESKRIILLGSRKFDIKTFLKLFPTFPAAFQDQNWPIWRPVLHHLMSSTSPSGASTSPSIASTSPSWTSTYLNYFLLKFSPEILRLERKYWQTKKFVQRYISELKSLCCERMRFLWNPSLNST